MIRANVQRMTGYTPGEQPADPRIVKLNTNECPYPPSARVMDALRELSSDALRRYPDPHCGALREKLAERHGCRPEQVVVGNGSDELLALCTRAFVDNDGAIGHFDPTYSLYETLIAIRDVRSVVLDLDAGFGWPLDTAMASLAADPGCTLFFFANPNAPTGRQCPLAEVRRFAEGFQGVVVLDEAYVDFAAEDGMALGRELPNVVVTRTLSKSSSLAGARLGYAVGPVALIEALMKIKDSYNVNAMTQCVAAAVLDDEDGVRANVERVLASRERLARELISRGFEVPASQANFLWVRPGGSHDAPGVYEGLKARGVLIRYFPGPRTGEYVRISVGSDPEVNRLLEAIDDMGEG